MIEVRRGDFGGWVWYATVNGKGIGTGTAPTEEMAWDGAQDCVDEYVRGIAE